MPNKVINLENNPTNDSSSDSADVTSFENTIYFYCDVCASKVLEFNKKLVELDQQNYINAITKRSFGNDDLIIDPIIVKIHSYGGSIFAGISAMDSILACKSPVYTIIDGAAASAATFLSVVGTKRFITRHSYALIHQLSSVLWGKFEEMKDDMVTNEKLMKMIKNIYEQYTKINKEDLEEILKHDIWWSSEECLEKGLVDEVL